MSRKTPIMLSRAIFSSFFYSNSRQWISDLCSQFIGVRNYCTNRDTTKFNPQSGSRKIINCAQFDLRTMKRLVRIFFEPNYYEWSQVSRELNFMKITKKILEEIAKIELIDKFRKIYFKKSEFWSLMQFQIKKGTDLNRPYGLYELLDMNFCFTRVNKLVFDSSISLWQSIDCEMMI